MNLRKIALEEWAKTQHDREERDSEDRERFRAYAARKLSDMLRVDAQEIIKNVNLDNQFLVGELLIQARRVASGEVDFRILLPCPDCGLNVWSRPFYGLSDLGEVIENSITDYTHVCRSEAVHKPSWMITSDEIDIAYNELLTARRRRSTRITARPVRKPTCSSSPPGRSSAKTRTSARLPTEPSIPCFTRTRKLPASSPPMQN